MHEMTKEEIEENKAYAEGFTHGYHEKEEQDEPFVFFVHNVPTQNESDKKNSRYTRKLIIAYCLFVSLLIIVFWYYNSLEKIVEEGS